MTMFILALVVIFVTSFSIVISFPLRRFTKEATKIIVLYEKFKLVLDLENVHKHYQLTYHSETIGFSDLADACEYLQYHINQASMLYKNLGCIAYTNRGIVMLYNDLTKISKELYNLRQHPYFRN